MIAMRTVVLLGCLAFGMPSCCCKVDQRAAPGASVMLAMQSEWRQRRFDGSEWKTSFEKTIKWLQTYYIQSGEGRRAEMKEYCMEVVTDELMPSESDQYEILFRRDVRLAVTQASLQLGDGMFVLEVLSKFCPEYIGIDGVEYYLAGMPVRTQKLDGLNILFVARKQTSDILVRYCLEDVLDRTFGPFVPKTEGRFDRYQEWLDTHREALVVNQKYLLCLLYEEGSGPCRLFE